MLKKKHVAQFNNRIKNYDNFTTEKEIETEFYYLIKKFYYNRYTKLGSGIINYTAPYNIDGLLEVRTLDSDYRILVEAKASKDFNSEEERNAVLSQAIYYCRKLHHYGEKIPTVIVLIERKSIIVLKTDELKDLIEYDFNGNSPSGAFKSDEKLIRDLKNRNYNYFYYDLFENDEINNIFNRIITLSENSSFNTFKNNLVSPDRTYNIFANFTENHKDIVFDGKDWYIFQDKDWVKTEKYLIMKKILEYSKSLKMKMRKIDTEYLIELLMGYYYCENSNYIKFSNGIVDIKSKKFVDDGIDNFYKLVLYYPYVKTDKSFKFLSMSDFLSHGRKIFIKTQKNNYASIENLSFCFNLTIGDLNIYDGSNITVFDNITDLKSDRNDFSTLKSNGIIIEELHEEFDTQTLLSMLLNTNSQLSKESIEYNRIFLENWNEENDLIFAWFKECLNPNPKSMVVFSDALDSFNNFCISKGNSRVSSRYFSQAFTTHRIFRTYSLVYYKHSRMGKDYEQSIWNDPNDPLKQPRIYVDQGTFITGVEFSTD